jgi:creatinine amidohydrolase
MTRRWLLGDLTYADLAAATPEVAVLPFGATEPHNRHLPYATDAIEADAIAAAACRHACERGAWAVALPTVPYGTETNMRGLPFAMDLRPSTILAILRDLVDSLADTGIRKCVILNSHGGNEFRGHLRELYSRTPVQLFLCDWWLVDRDRQRTIFAHPDDHAGETETSLLLHLRPDLVRMDLAADGATRAPRFAALAEGWIKTTRPWPRLTPSTGSGDPREATADKGAAWLAHLAARLGDFLVELARSPLDEDFPFVPAT